MSPDAPMQIGKEPGKELLTRGDDRGAACDDADSNNRYDIDRFLPRWDRGPRQGFFYGLTVFFVRVAAITLFDVRVFGMSKIPPRGAVLLASTHQSVADPMLLGMLQDRMSCYLAKESLFRVPFLGWLIRKYAAFPIPRESISSRRALDVCIGILKRGRSLVFFPEGTRTTDGRLQPLRRGVALIAKRTAAWVVPILIDGTFRAWPRGALLPRPRGARLTIGDPIRFKENEQLDSFIDRLTQAYCQLAIEAGAAGGIGVGGGGAGAGGAGAGGRAGAEPGAEPETAPGDVARPELRDAVCPGVRDVHDVHCPGEGEKGPREAPPAPVSPEPEGLQRPAGERSLVACTTHEADGRLSGAEA